MEKILSLENVDFAYQDAYILKNVNFSVNAGESIGIIGPNGGGKTTLLRLIMGFLKPISGRILLFGQAPCHSIKDVGYVPQVMRFDKQFPISVFELVLLGRLSRLPWYGRFSSEDYLAASDMIEKVGLKDFQHCAFGTLSGGQAQRALIARALVAEPKLLLLDEPTASVDTQAEAQIYQLLRELKKDITIIMVTHDLNVAIDQVERVLCVRNNVMSLLPQEVCEHFALGLYHAPLMGLGKKT